MRRVTLLPILPRRRVILIDVTGEVVSPAPLARRPHHDRVILWVAPGAALDDEVTVE